MPGGQTAPGMKLQSGAVSLSPRVGLFHVPRGFARWVAVALQGSSGRVTHAAVAQFSVTVATGPFISRPTWFCTVRGRCCPRVVWPRMLRIPPLHFLLHLGIGVLPEVAQVGGDLQRLAARREQVQQHGY